jgi:hypothetical protein
MASLHEYFKKDSSSNLTVQEQWNFSNADGTNIEGEVIARLHYDFDAFAKYVSFFIPKIEGVECPEALLLNKIPEMLSWPETKVAVSAGFQGDQTDARDLIFTGRVYLYSERAVREDLKAMMMAEAKARGHSLVFRSVDYMNMRNRWEKPRAFISHDSRDKREIAEPLAIQLQKFMCSVWYDDFTLKVGDSLRESIETGLKECPKCILILTPNFLSNGGWSKREYDSIFTRELVEKQRVILPVWHGVAAEDVYKYSPILADRFAVQWSMGVEEVARKLTHSIDA